MVGRRRSASTATSTRATAVVHALRGVDSRSAAASWSRSAAARARGKTTLLNLLGGLDRPDAGHGRRRRGRGDRAGRGRAASTLRRDTVGYVFQAFGLIPILSRGRERRGAAAPGPRPIRRERDARVDDAARAGRPRRARAPPAVRAVGRRAAAGGDRPRAGQPARSCCSPTSRPASSTRRPATRSWTCSARWSATEGVTAVVATHDPAMLDVADRVLELRDGRLAERGG